MNEYQLEALGQYLASWPEDGTFEDIIESLKHNRSQCVDDCKFCDIYAETSVWEPLEYNSDKWIAEQIEEKAKWDEEESKDYIIIKWHIDDVKEIRPDLNDSQCREVLFQAKHRHDATIGINWDVLKVHADILFGENENE